MAAQVPYLLWCSLSEYTVVTINSSVLVDAERIFVGRVEEETRLISLPVLLAGEFASGLEDIGDGLEELY